MAIKAADVKKLRDATGAGMMDAKKALTEADGDFDKAVDLLRVAGQAKAAKRSDREAANGLVVGAGNALVQIGSETDFVAQTLEDLAGTIGEKIELADAAYFEGNTHIYLHRRSQDLPPQVGVMVEYTGEDTEAVHGVCLQIAAMNPRWVNRDEVPADVIDHERTVAADMAREEGKPEKIIDRIVEGRLGGFYKENCLLEQPAVSDDKKSVGDLLKAAGVTVKRFVRLSAGE